MQEFDVRIIFSRGEYRVSLSIGNEEYEGRGDDLSDALLDLSEQLNIAGH